MSKEITIKSISTQVQEWAPGLKDFALTEFDQQRFFKTAIMAISENSDLMECMETPAGRASLYSSMKRAFSTGLSLNPQEGKAAIIAYKGKASYQIMKEGAIELLLNSGDIKTLMVEIVYENDEFSIEKSNKGDTYHFSPVRKNRGGVDGYFCAITDKDDISYVKYMTQEECFEIRDTFSTGYIFAKDKAKSGWGKSPKGYSKKTVIKAAIRDLHISPKAKALFSSEDVDFYEEPEIKDVTPKKATGNTGDDVAKKLEGKKEGNAVSADKKTDGTEEKTVSAGTKTGQTGNQERIPLF